MAITSLKLEATFGSEYPAALKARTESLRKALHENTSDAVELYEDLSSYYSENIKETLPQCLNGLPKFLNNYLTQVETLLASISAVHNRDFESSLTLLDKKVKYYAATDLPNYFRVIPVHLAEMNELKTADPASWERLKKDFVVTKSTEAFCNLFVDQALEQEIKELKRHGHLPGLTQDEEAMNRFITIAPHLANYVYKFMNMFPKSQLREEQPEVYHQLKGNMALRCALNSTKIKASIISFCKGNPFTSDNSQLKNIVSGAIIPESAAADIINYPEKGQVRYEKFIEDRLKIGSSLSIWDRLPQLRLKRFSTWSKTKKISIGNKVLKLREDRQFLSKVIIIAQRRPELINKMENMVGHYEMSIIPRANFAPDGSILLTSDKFSLMKQILDQTPLQGEASQAGDKPQVLIIDAMPEVKCLKKRANTTKLGHLKDDFVHRIRRKAEKGNYREIYVAFDEWWTESLKNSCRSHREEAAGVQECKGFDMHDEMCLKKTSLAQLLSTKESKIQIATYFTEGLLEEYKGSQTKLVVTCKGKIHINKPHTLPQGFTCHSHEEADTQIPLLMNFSLSENTYKHFDVYSPDTDVLVILMDLVSNGYTGTLTSIILHAGNEKSPKTIDVLDRVKCVGKRKSQALIGFHAFSGEDHGNKFVGISKNHWCKLFFSLPPENPIIDTFIQLGTLTADQCSLQDGSLHQTVQPLETFTCMGYDSTGPSSIPELRWRLWSKKNKEAENLPPSRATICPMIQRTNHVSRVYKSYINPNPILPATTESGWKRDPETNTLFPIYCLFPPAPAAILELVKCGCDTSCSKNICSCYKGRVPCTSLCKCTDECLNVH